MAKRKRQDLDRVTINLYPGDLEWLQAVHTPPGAGPIIRELVRNYRLGREAEAQERISLREMGR